MLDLPQSSRKYSLGHLSDAFPGGGFSPKAVELPVGQLIQDHLGGRIGQIRVCEQGLRDAPTESPPGVPGDRRERLGSRAGERRRLHDVGFRRETVVQEGGDDPRFGVLPEGEKEAAPRYPRKVDPFGDCQLREPPEEVRVGGTADLGMDAHIRREVSQVTPVERPDQGERLRPGGVPVAREGPANGVEAASLRVLEDLFDVGSRQVRPSQLPEKLAFGPHR